MLLEFIANMILGTKHQILLFLLTHPPWLLCSNHPVPFQKHSQGLVAVSQSSTPGQSRLPNAAKEVAQIEKLTSNLHYHTLSSELATVERVVEGMEKHSWVHFACHAGQDIVEPTKSAFYLQDGNLPLSKIITKSFPHADFAFLSACQTARGVETFLKKLFIWLQEWWL
jgi:CHAT domain-containing protein